MLCETYRKKVTLNVLHEWVGWSLLRQSDKYSEFLKKKLVMPGWVTFDWGYFSICIWNVIIWAKSTSLPTSSCLQPWTNDLLRIYVHRKCKFKGFFLCSFIFIFSKIQSAQQKSTMFLHSNNKGLQLKAF